MLFRVVLSLAIMTACLALGSEKGDIRLSSVTTIFISGNNEAAEGARAAVLAGKTCFSLSGKSGDADAVLDIAASAQSQGGVLGGMGGRNWTASGTLTLKSGDLVWSRSERFMDAPARSGGRVAGRLLAQHLADAASCKARKK